jgi:hypothetical protein
MDRDKIFKQTIFCYILLLSLQFLIKRFPCIAHILTALVSLHSWGHTHFPKMLVSVLASEAETTNQKAN